MDNSEAMEVTSLHAIFKKLRHFLGLCFLMLIGKFLLFPKIVTFRKKYPPKIAEKSVSALAEDKYRMLMEHKEGCLVHFEIS